MIDPVFHTTVGLSPDLSNPEPPSTSTQPAATSYSAVADFSASPSKLFYQMVQTSSGFAAQHVDVSSESGEIPKRNYTVRVFTLQNA